jgi:hypothetical protein
MPIGFANRVTGEAGPAQGQSIDDASNGAPALTPENWGRVPMQRARCFRRRFRTGIFRRLNKSACRQF